MTEDELHAHPDYQALEQVMAALYALIGDGDEAAQQRMHEHVDRTVDSDVLFHFAGHHSLDIGVHYVPPPLLQIFHTALLSTWRDGFLLGVKFQTLRSDQIAATVIPDSLDGLT